MPRLQVRLHTFLATGIATAALPLTRASLDCCLKLPSSSPTTSTVSDGLSMISGTGVAVLSVTGGYGSRLCAIAAAVPCFAIAYVVPAAALYVIERAQRRTFLSRRRPNPTAHRVPLRQPWPFQLKERGKTADC